jgi:hypothetical protein
MSLSQSCTQISPVLLEIKLGAELHLHKSVNAGVALNFKYTTQFLYGEDIRDQIPVPSVNDWVQWAMSAPQASLMVTRSTKALIFPLSQPDPEAEFYGYDRQTIPGADGIDRPSSKWLVATVGWIATALVARQTEQYVGSKGEIVQLYKTQIQDQWTGLVEQVYEQCRNHWNYLIPNEEADRQRLRSLCQAALDFSNHYMMEYRDFVLRELCEESSRNQLQSVKCLAHMIYPGDQEVTSLLKKLQQSSDEEIKRAVYETEEQIKQILSAA